MRARSSHWLAWLLLCGTAATSEALEPDELVVRELPATLTRGEVEIPWEGGEDVARVEMLVNGVPFRSMEGSSGTFVLDVGGFIRRLRLRFEAYDQEGELISEVEQSLNDPHPPFRVRLRAPADLPETGPVSLIATVTKPRGWRVTGVDFFVGEQRIGGDTTAPYKATFLAEAFPDIRYARVVARASTGAEENAVHYFGGAPSETMEVNLHQIPLSIAGETDGRLEADEFTLYENGEKKAIERLEPAQSERLSVVLMIDSSQSIEEELPLIREAALAFSRSILAPGNADVAIVAFNQGTYWLTGFTANMEAVERAVSRLTAVGRTHLYDATIEMMYTLQRRSGRRALIVLSDGVNQGGYFTLDHVVHYARYSGVPVYPVVRNTLLSRLMRFGLRYFDANKYAEIAEEAGARYFIVNSPNDLPDVYGAIARELKRQYLISFYSEGTGRDTWARLRLESTRDDIDFRIPRGYFR